MILTRCHDTVEEGDRVAQLVLERVRAPYRCCCIQADFEGDIYSGYTDRRGARRERARCWRFWEHWLNWQH